MITEENIEFVDWSLVPIEDITPKIKEKFGSSVEGLKIRLWFEDLLSNMEIKIDEKKYPDYVFFFYCDELYMDLNIKNGYLGCSYEYIWSVFDRDYSSKYSDIQLFIKNIVEQHFKTKETTPSAYFQLFYSRVEQHFKTKETTPHNIRILYYGGVEQHFKDIEVRCATETNQYLVQSFFNNK